MPPRGILALRSALQALLRSGAPDEAVRRAVALFCAEARRRGLRVEQVIVALKDVLRTLPEIRRLRRAERDPALAHLTTLTIRTYYESEARPADVAPVRDFDDTR